MKRIFVWCVLVLMCMVAVCGCDSNLAQQQLESSALPQESLTQAEDPETENTEPTSTALPVTMGSLETELLKTTTWDSGRANETSGGYVWETETGYYLIWMQILYYADKTDVTTWIPVCSKPDCTHSSFSDEKCDALVPMELLLDNGRFYYNTQRSFTPAATSEELWGDILVSMAPDGTDKKLELYFEDVEAVIPLGDTISDRSILFEDHFVYCFGAMDESGLMDTCIYLADSEGVEVLFEGKTEGSNLGAYPSRSLMNVFGDSGFFCEFVEGNTNAVYRVENRELVSVDLYELPREGSYLHGDILRFFRPGDGYYEVDLRTRAETKLSDAQLSNSQAYVILPNCILESTLLGEYSLDWRENVESNAMKLYNGQEWLDVELPEELIGASDTTVLYFRAVTSDRILLVSKDIARTMRDEESGLYQILLTTDTPTLEYLGPIG